MKSLVLVLATLISSSAIAHSGCKIAQPTFGRGVATCGNWMITYLGDIKTEAMGVPVTRSEFALLNCNTGHIQRLDFQEYVQGYTMTTTDEYSPERFEVAFMWGEFELARLSSDGRETVEACYEYNGDNRPDSEVEYVYPPYTARPSEVGSDPGFFLAQ